MTTLDLTANGRAATVEQALRQAVETWVRDAEVAIDAGQPTVAAQFGRQVRIAMEVLEELA